MVSLILTWKTPGWSRVAIALFSSLRAELLHVKGLGPEWQEKGVVRQLLAVAGERRGAGGTKNAGRRKATKLNKAASKSMQQDSVWIAQTLLQNAMKGNVASLRCLFELAEGSQEELGVGEARLTRSIANELAEEPQWHDESTEETTVIGMGGREPEG